MRAKKVPCFPGLARPTPRAECCVARFLLGPARGGRADDLQDGGADHDEDEEAEHDGTDREAVLGLLLGLDVHQAALVDVLVELGGGGGEDALGGGLSREHGWGCVGESCEPNGRRVSMATRVNTRGGDAGLGPPVRNTWPGADDREEFPAAPRSVGVGTAMRAPCDARSLGLRHVYAP